MKVILLKDLPNLGQRGDIKEVNLGYARNYLIPQGFVKEATDAAIKDLEAQKEKEAKMAEADLEQMEKLASSLEGQIIEITTKASEEGTLYGAISPAKIVSALKEKGFEIRKDQIKTGHIKEVGEHEVAVDLDHGLEARITLIINSE